jgi:hypothetical protein
MMSILGLAGIVGIIGSLLAIISKVVGILDPIIAIVTPVADAIGKVLGSVLVQLWESICSLTAKAVPALILTAVIASGYTYRKVEPQSASLRNELAICKAKLRPVQRKAPAPQKKPAGDFVWPF